MVCHHRHFIAFVVTIVISSCAFANVTVKRDPPDVQVRTFDPAKPPADMPHLEPGEAAVTGNVFHVQAGGNSEILTRKKGDNGWTTQVLIKGVSLSLQLRVIIWLPQNATEKLKAHEEGHRKIAEQIYQDRALVEAKAAGALADGKRVTGEGPNWKAAGDNAVDPVINAAGKAYLAQTADMANEVNNIYDDLTRHGTNDKPEEVAIKEAFAKYAELHAVAK